MEEATELRVDSNSLLKAMWLGRLRLAKLLVEVGPYINESNEKGETALMVACTTPHADQQSASKAKLVKYLLENQVEPSIQDKLGKTALMHACLQGAGEDVVSLLMGKGADSSLEDHTGTSGLLYPLNADRKGMLQCFLRTCRAQGKEVIILTTTDQSAFGGSGNSSHCLNGPPSLESGDSPDTGATPPSTDLKPASPGSLQGRGKQEASVCSAQPRGSSMPKSPQEPPTPARKVGCLCRAGLPQMKMLQSEPWGLLAPASLVATTSQLETRRPCPETSEASTSPSEAALPRRDSLASKGRGSSLLLRDKPQVASKPSSPPAAPPSSEPPQEKSLQCGASLLRWGHVPWALPPCGHQ